MFSRNESRRDFLKGCGGFLGASALLATPASAISGFASNQRPNILWIVLDDIGPDLGCYGMEQVSTPNLDRLAGEGVLFTNAFATATVCTPSRSSFFTGMYPTTIGVQDHPGQIGDLPEGVYSLTTLLRRAGYFSVNLESEGGFNEKKVYGTSGKTHWNFRPRIDAFDTKHMWDADDPSTLFSGGGWESKSADQPFFAYANIETAKAHGFGRGRRWALENGVSLDASKVELPPYYPDTNQMRNRLGMYYDAVMHADHVVGKVLAGLKAAGYADNTLVFFFSDHGRAMMRHKQWLYDGGIHVPLIVRWPSVLDAGSVRRDMISLMDVAPTALQAAGIDPPHSMEALPMFGDREERNYIFAARDRCDRTVDKVRAVRTRRFKYIRNLYPERPYTQESSYAMGAFMALRLLTEMVEKNEPLTPQQRLFMAERKPEEELYDVQTDPYEVHNLVDEVEYIEVLHEMREIMSGHLD